MTMFDFVLLLIISEGTQQALVGEDYSVVGGMTAVATLFAIDIAISLLKSRFQKVEKFVDNVPVLLIEGGRIHRERLQKERVDEADILAFARENHGISRLDEIDYAILETNGAISVIVKPAARSA